MEIPGKNRADLVDAVKRTAQLRFRLVAGQPQPGTPAPERASTVRPAPPARPRRASRPKTPKAGKATPNPRPAPFARRDHTLRVAPGAEPDSASAPPRLPIRASRITQKGASVDDPLAWSQNPGVEWLQKFSKFTCPPKGENAAPIADNADEPLIACDDEGQKLLLSKSLIEGTELKSASYGTPQNGVGWAVNLAFKSTARKVFADTTTALNQNNGTFAIVLDGNVISYAGVNEPHPRRQCARSPVTSRSPRRARSPTR